MFPLLHLAVKHNITSKNQRLGSVGVGRRIFGYLDNGKRAHREKGFDFQEKPLRLVLQNASCELFMEQVPATSPFVQTLGD